MDEFGPEAVRAAIQEADGPAICAYLTGGFPSAETFPEVLRTVATAADVVEVGVPFTDPLADGLTIQEASRRALTNGVTLESIIETLQRLRGKLEAPHLLMGYYNPFLALGLERLAASMAASATSGLIVPDLPLEECSTLSSVLELNGLGLVQLVTPTTPEARLARLASASRGFVYAVTTTGVTGGTTKVSPETITYLDRVRAASPLPVLAGFGVRDHTQVDALAAHVDGVVVGSALIEVIDRGDDPAQFLAGLR